MRRYAAAALSVPVLALIYLTLLLRRSVFVRTGVAVAVGAALGLGVIGLSRPAATQATLPNEVVPLTNAAFRTAVRTGLSPDAPISVSFSTPMERRSVEAALRIEPSTAVRLVWDATATTLTVRPRTSWQAGTYHTVTIDAGALATTGRPLAGPVRSAFLTRDPTTATIAATELHGRRALPGTAFVLDFAHPVDLEAVRASLVVEPAIAGALERRDVAGDADRLVFVPRAPLRPNTVYRLRLGPGARDAAGAALADVPVLAVRTAASPAVVRFRPLNDTKAVVRDALLSVRFTQAMDKRSTKAAFRASIDGRPIRGTISFAERATVLVFDPAHVLPYGKVVKVTVGPNARSVAGLKLTIARGAQFRTLPRPAPQADTTGSQPIPPSGGGSAGGGSWRAVETYYLRLMNCTRTGGWVTATGRCDSPGGRSVAPLWIDRGISSSVARPYARLLATRGACDHYIGGSPGDRLARAGYTSYIWAENLGCRSGNPYSAVLGSHRFFQDEWDDGDPTDHYTNLMNPDYDRVGLGVWVSSGNVRLVVDFYHPR